MTSATSTCRDSDTRRAHARGATAALVAPLVLVNTVAVYGQAGWAYDNLTTATLRHDHAAVAVAVSLLFAATVESIGIYLAAEAHRSLMAGDASLRLRLASYAVGALVGALNYAHFATPDRRPTAVAVTFGLLSSISPWLWAIRSRSMNRDRLRELGQVDPRAVRFAPLRWALYPSATWRAFRAAVWAGVVVPADAVALVAATTTPVATQVSVPVAPERRSVPVPATATPEPVVSHGDTDRHGDSDSAPTDAAPAPVAARRVAAAASRGRHGSDNKARARQLCRDGRSVAEILTELGLGRDKRRNVERWTADLRQERAS